MNPVTSHKRNLENNSNRRQFLPPFYGDYVEQSFQTEARQERVDSNQLKIKSPMGKKTKPPTSGMQQMQDISNRNNSFWVSISGYPPEQTLLVYRFFQDIGHIVDKCFTDSNLMYLKYSLFSDCKIALSYDNQKIGYGGDIHVRIQPEGPVVEQPIRLSNVEKVACTTTTPCQSVRSSVAAVQETNGRNTPLGNIEMEVQKSIRILQRASTQVPANSIVIQENSKKNLGFLQWLKQTVSYIFYLY